FVGELFPDGIRPDQAFFKRLAELQLRFCYTRRGDEAIGLVWSSVLRTLPSADQQSLLSAFAEQTGQQVLELLGSLWVVIRDHDFPASFLSERLVHVVRAVERDVLQDGVW